MKTTLKRCLAVVAFLTLAGYLFVHVSYMLRDPLAHTRNNLSGYYDLDKDSLDVVFIGTSGTFSAFSPMEAWEKYGFTSYNFCINVMGTDAMATAVHEALKTQAPKVLVIDIYPFMVEHRLDRLLEYATRYNTDGYRYSLDRLKLILDALPDSEDKLSYIFDIIKYHTNTLTWKNFFGSYHYVEKGYNFLGWIAANPAVLTEEREEMKDVFEKDLDQLLAECDRHPETNILFSYYPYGDIWPGTPTYMARVNHIQDRVEAAGYPFRNWVLVRDEFGLDYQRDYWGDSHFNIYGAEKITSVVGNYLKTEYDLPCRWKDPAYSSWNDDLYAYHSDVKIGKAFVDDQIA